MNAPFPQEANRTATFLRIAGAALLPVALAGLTGCGVSGSAANLSANAVLATPAAAQATAPGPIVISKGGTYSGNWTSNDPAVAAVTITTNSPVILQNATVSGRGDLITMKTYGANVTVRNVTGKGLDPQVAGAQRGVFLRGWSANTLTVQNCTMTGTSFGIYVGYSAFQSLKILNNRAIDLEDRTSDGKGGFQNSRPVLGHFIQLSKLSAPNGAEIAWNELKQTVGTTSTEDGINIYLSTGTASTPIAVHDNYVEGNSSPAKASYSGNGLITDGNSSGDTGYVLMQDNQVVHTAGGGMSIANGHDVTFRNNRVVSCGRDAQGNWYSTVGASAVGLWNYYANPNFTRNLITGTTGGMVTRNAKNVPVVSNIFANSTGATNAISSSNFTNPCILPSGDIDPAAEDAERTAWQQKQQAAGQKIGDQH